MQIIGLGHQSRVGKDTFANELVAVARHHGLRAQKFAFADELKHAAHNIFYYTGLEDRLHYEIYPERRSEKLRTPKEQDAVDLWIEFGNAMRRIDPHVWITHTMRSINCSRVDLAVVSDLRFPNEAEVLRLNCARLVNVTRSGVEIRGSDARLGKDFAWDFVVENNGSVADLQRLAQDFFAQHISGENPTKKGNTRCPDR